MKFIHNLQFAFYLLLVGFLSTSCHNNSAKSNRQVKASDSVSTQHGGDTIMSGINYYTGQITAHPNDAGSYWNRGNLEMLNKNYGAALGDLTKAVTLDSTKSDYFYSLANAEFITGHTHESRDAFLISIRLNPKNTDAILKLAELYFYVEKYADAMSLIDQAIKVNPFIAREYFLKGMIFREQHDTGKAISSFQTAVEQDPNYYNAFIQLGLLFASKGNPIALSYYDDAATLQPQNPEPYYNKGMFYQFGGDYEDAIKTYRELLLIDSTYKNAYYNLGVIYNVNKSDYSTSLNYFNKAIQCDTAYFMAYYGRGNCYEMMKQPNKALADYAHAYRINPAFKAAEEAYKNLKSKTH